MGILDIVSGVGNLLSAPINAISGWIEEPLKGIQANRDRKNEDKKVEREIRKETALSELRRAEDAAKLDNQIKAETEKEKIRSGIALNEEKSRIQMEVDKTRELSEIAQTEREHQTDMQIKMQTEVNRINVEIEEMQKDREIERGKEVLDAVFSYQKKMAEFETFIMNAIGTMSIDLQNRVILMEHEWKQRFAEYRDTQLKSIRQYIKDTKEMFGDDPDLLKQMNSECFGMLSETIKSCNADIADLRLRIESLSTNLNSISSETHKTLMEQVGNLKQISAIQQNAIATNTTNIISGE